jgi:putative heme-binding domain-containing protein
MNKVIFVLPFLVWACSQEPEIPLDPKVAKLKLPEGFVAEHLYSPGEQEQGSWVGMTFDDRGRMLATDQYGSIYRCTFPAIGSEDTTRLIEKLDVDMGFAQGILYAFNSLYVMVNHRANDELGKNTGLYRLRDTDGDDQFDEVQLIRELTGEPGEHGPHSMVVSPDGESIYVVAGNHIDVPEMEAYRVPKNWNEDNIFPLIKDPRGHANNRGAPGGWIAKIDPEGKTWELFSVGFRNAYDIAFNEHGDLFTYDSDMEWDFGMPWYRPTRICHVTSGSEFGWRTGNQKWLPEYPDNLPALLNIGQGSPTNVMFGTGAAFPEKYQKALFAFDWSFGIIYSVFMEPSGGTYKATAAEFISGAPLPLTDGAIGPDGAMYFMTGGRRLESDVYRVYYKGRTSPAGKARALPEAAVVRRNLEKWHSADAPESALGEILAGLEHEDRFVRYAARIALEHQPMERWVGKSEHPLALMAMVRNGGEVGEALMAADFSKDPMTYLRVVELMLYRKGSFPEGLKEKISPLFPSGDNSMDRMLAKILAYMGDEGATGKMVALLETAEDDAAYQKTFTSSSDLILRNPQYGLDIAGMLAKVPPAQQTYFAVVLGGAEKGWTEEWRERYFKWIHRSFEFKGGNSYVGFMDRARKMALAKVASEDFDRYNEMSGAGLLTKSGNDLMVSDVQPEGPWRVWKMEDAVKVVEDLDGRDLEKGKAMYAASLCKSCHQIKGEGGNIGPDLSQLATRFSPKDVLESIIEPSKLISDQYASTIYVMKDGSSVVGKQVSEDDKNYYISQNPYDPDQIREIVKREVKEKKLSEVSPMMTGLVNRLNEEELKDLIAYLIK